MSKEDYATYEPVPPIFYFHQRQWRPVQETSWEHQSCSPVLVSRKASREYRLLQGRLILRHHSAARQRDMEVSHRIEKEKAWRVEYVGPLMTKRRY